jgi:hypothetical protein
MDQSTRNTLRNVVTQCRRLLEESVAQVLQGQFGIYAAGKKDEVQIEPEARMSHLSDEDRAYRQDLLDHYEHIKALGYKAKDALGQLIREVAFTHLNRFCAYRMMESRGLIRESVSKGLKSQGFLFYLADHEEDERRFNTGQQDVAYRHFLNWLGGTLSEEIGVLFAPTDPANRLYPPQRVIEQVLGFLNDPDLVGIWSEDEAIGWVYQYFTPKELRDQARKESQAPRNSYELAFRNQFFTPRYVVEFLTDNTLGRIWYEMRRGDTRLKDQCRYMVRRATEVFLKDGESEPKDAATATDDLSQEELLKLPVHVPFRAKKDPRELRILDPACGSGHFLLYCFDLLLTIYEEAYGDPDLGPALKKDYPTLDALRRDVPRLLLAHNLHGIDIDPRASQIAALALWLRCQRVYQEMGIKQDRPKITRSNIVCAERMPGEERMLKEFVDQLEPKVLGQLVQVVFEEMKAAGDVGSLLNIDLRIQSAIAAAKTQFARETTHATDRKGRALLFSEAEMGRLSGDTHQPSLFDVSDVTDSTFFEQAESRVLETLRSYAEAAQERDKLQRRLFTDDAVRGFAFVDLCRQLYDVVLMNPPFGATSESSKQYVFSVFDREKIELGACFITHFRDRLVPNGFLGAITHRTILFSGTLQNWRESQLKGLSTCADLGLGVLDAFVETAAYTARKTTHRHGPTFFFQLLDSRDKGSELLRITNAPDDETDGRTFPRTLESFDTLPNAPLAYWLPTQLLSQLSAVRSAGDTGIAARSGLQTCDNFRFLRFSWEIPHFPQHKKEKEWCKLTKGGEYSPFWSDIPLHINWTNNGQELKDFIVTLYGQWSKQIPSVGLYRLPGITYTERTNSALSLRVLPANCIFDKKGPFVGFPTQSGNKDEILAFIGLSYTTAYRVLVDSAIGLRESTEASSPSRDYLPSIIQSLPLPAFAAVDLKALAHASQQCIEAHRLLQSATFPCSLWRPLVDWGSSTSLKQLVADDSRVRHNALEKIYESFDVIEKLANRLFFGAEEPPPLLQRLGATDLFHYSAVPQGVNAVELAANYQLTEESLVDVVAGKLGDTSRVLKLSYVGDRRIELLSQLYGIHPTLVVKLLRAEGCIPRWQLERTANDILDVVLGCALGRLAAKAVRDLSSRLSFPDVFEPLADPSVFYEPSSTDCEGLLVDDPHHPLDVVGQVRHQLEHIWEGAAGVFEEELCETFGSDDLRAYLRKSGSQGFWGGHISRHSRRLRHAPIYWLLQSSKKNYAIWLYYHRLDRDIIFKALVNYVEPKLRLEDDRLESLRAQKGGGGTGKATKKLDKEIEKQEDFLSELRDFEEKLRRAAELRLVPDLNDGVVLNIAPLHELVPWKEAEKYWKELLEGKYEWSSIGKQLREKGLVK